MRKKTRTAAAVAATFILAAAALPALNVGYGTTVPAEGKHTMYFFRADSTCGIVDVRRGEEPFYLKSALKGESVLLDDPAKAEKLREKFGAAFVFGEKVSGVENEYYFSSLIPAYITVNGKKINFHVAKRDGAVTVGIPFIFGSY